MGVVADRIGAFLRRSLKFAGIGDELAGNGIGGVGCVDQRGEMAGHGRRIASAHPRQSLSFGRRDEACRDKIVRLGEGARASLSGAGHGAAYTPAPFGATGVHSTCSIRSAPAASMTSRSKPSATPLASGMISSAARKSVSIG